MVGGVIVLGESTITFFSVTLDTFQMRLDLPTLFESYTPFGEGNDQWILGDSDGKIYSLSINHRESFMFAKLGEVFPIFTFSNDRPRFHLSWSLLTLSRYSSDRISLIPLPSLYIQLSPQNKQSSQI